MPSLEQSAGHYRYLEGRKERRLLKGGFFRLLLEFALLLKGAFPQA